ncbi:MAG: type 4a pilus biogenesis protein PilO [Thermodesulfobacteriota bacterium]
MSLDKAKIQAAINAFLDEKVAALKAPHKLGIALVLLLLPCAVFYFFSYSPKSKEIASLETTRAGLAAEVSKVEKAAGEIEKHRAEMKETELMFAEASKLLPQEQEIPSLLTSISDLGQQSGLDFLSFIPKVEARKEFYAEIPVDIKVRGPYHNVGVFLDAVSDLERIVTVSNIAMGGPKKVAGEMILETSFNLITYRFVEPEAQPAAPQKKGK